ncbi:MAG: choice-of-anchor J domain-containing protein [candidate division WOR-3 bacterium]|nr:choice-of-anchor J domain-containing protein [candidate division WOR-3 bacterium]
MRSRAVILFIAVLSAVYAGNYPLEKVKSSQEHIAEEEILSLINHKEYFSLGFPRAVIFAENFTGSEFPPQGWQVISTNNGYTGTNPCFWSRFTSPSYLIHSLPAACGLWWSYQTQNEWLISSEITLSGGADNRYYLRFWTYGYLGSADSDHYYVKISTDGGASWNILYDLSAQLRGWNRYEEPIYIDLSAYANQTIKLAWHADDGPINQGLSYVWFIDDIEVGTPFEHDVGVLSLLNIKYLPLLQSQPDTFCIRVFNFGLSDEPNVIVKMTANDNLISELTLALGALSYKDTFFVWIPADSGNFTVKFFTELLEDQDNGNDTIRILVDAGPQYYSVPYSKDFNEDWGPLGNNPPHGGWEIIDRGSENPKRWNRNDWFKGYLASVNREVAMVRYQPIEYQDEWLISPRIDCSQDTQYTLSFWHQYEGYRNAVPDTGYVLISTDGGTSWQELCRYSGGISGIISSGYQNFNITNLVVGNNNVKIAFRYYAHNAARWAIDDFTVMTTPNIDVCPVQLRCPQSVTLGETLKVVGVIKNTGRQTLNPNWYIIYTINDDYDSILVNVVLNPQDTYKFSFAKVISEIDTFEITVRTRYPNDEYPLNDFLTRTTVSSGWREQSWIPAGGNGRGVKDGAALVSFTDSIFAFRGGNSNDFYVYFTTSDSWAPRKPIGFALKPDSITPIKKYVKSGGALTKYRDSIYAFKGGNTSEFWLYIPGMDSWIQKKGIPKYWLPTAKPTGIKSGGALTTYKDSIYAFKGGNTYEFWLYINAYDSWAKRCSLLAPNGKMIKGGAALVTCGDTIYAFMGGNTNLFYGYLPAQNRWIMRAPPSFDNPQRPQKAKVKDGASLTVLDGKIYAFRGGNTKLFGYYEPAFDTWYRLENIPGIKKVKAGGALTSANGKIYAFKGGNTREFWAYYLPTSYSELSFKYRTKEVSYITPKITSSSTMILHGEVLTIQNAICDFSSSSKLFIKLYDITGKVLKTYPLINCKSGVYQLEVSELSRGVYYLHLEGNNDIKTVIKLVLLK